MDELIVDFPEFGTLADWEACLRDLDGLEPSDDVEIARLRCQTEIASLQGAAPPTAADRMAYEDGGFVFYAPFDGASN